jgi:hypothetical protein
MGHPDHPVKLEDLVSGNIIELPQRDPLTLKPVQPAKELSSSGR